MGPKSILRAAALLALTALGASARADVAAPVVVVELAGDAAAQLRAQLAAAGFAVLSGPELDEATTGRDGGRDLREALAQLAATRDAFARLDCAAALVAGRAAIAAMEARAAAGSDERAGLTAAWSYLLLCHDRAGDVDQAMRAAAALRVLGAASAPPGAALTAPIDAALWAKYPEVDVTVNRDVYELAIESEPDAVVTIDHRAVGRSPLKAFVPVGPHLVASGVGSRRAARWIDVTAPDRIELRLREQDAPLSRISERVASWKQRPPDGAQIASFLENLLIAAQGQPWNPSSARSPVLVILGLAGDPHRGQVWASDGPGLLPTTTEVALSAPVDASALLVAVRQRSLVWVEPRPEPVVSDRQVAPTVGERPRTQWWVYAALAGAVAVGAGVIVAQEASQDTQRVELRWP
jgi:hypothetical protein